MSIKSNCRACIVRLEYVYLYSLKFELLPMVACGFDMQRFFDKIFIGKYFILFNKVLKIIISSNLCKANMQDICSDM